MYGHPLPLVVGCMDTPKGTQYWTLLGGPNPPFWTPFSPKVAWIEGSKPPFWRVQIPPFWGVWIPPFMSESRSRGSQNHPGRGWYGYLGLPRGSKYPLLGYPIPPFWGISTTPVVGIPSLGVCICTLHGLCMHTLYM